MVGFTSSLLLPPHGPQTQVSRALAPIVSVHKDHSHSRLCEPFLGSVHFNQGNEWHTAVSMALPSLNFFISAICLVHTWLVPSDQFNYPISASSLSSFLELPPNLQIAVMPLFASHSPHAKHISTHPSVENHPRGSAQEAQTPSSRTRARRVSSFRLPLIRQLPLCPSSLAQPCRLPLPAVFSSLCVCKCASAYASYTLVSFGKILPLGLSVQGLPVKAASSRRRSTSPPKTRQLFLAPSHVFVPTRLAAHQEATPSKFPPKMILQ